MTDKTIQRDIIRDPGSAEERGLLVVEGHDVIPGSTAGGGPSNFFLNLLDTGDPLRDGVVVLSGK